MVHLATPMVVTDTVDTVTVAMADMAPHMVVMATAATVTPATECQLLLVSDRFEVS